MKVIQIIGPMGGPKPYQARFAKERGKWGAGATPSTAIGDLVRSWLEDFNVTISYTQEAAP